MVMVMVMVMAMMHVLVHGSSPACGKRSQRNLARIGPMLRAVIVPVRLNNWRCQSCTGREFKWLIPTGVYVVCVNR